MATLQVTTPFAESNALGKRALLTGLRRFDYRKMLRVSCQQSSVRAVVGGHRNGGESEGSLEVVSILQSSKNPLLNLPPEDLIAALAEKGNQSDTHGVVASAADRRKPASVQSHRSQRVIFTDEKARLLRKENRATQTFRHEWYHSAIANKLAMPE